MKMWQKLIVVLMTIGLSGCAGLLDAPKTIWGSSTRALEDARSNSLSKTYEKNYWDCFKVAEKVIKEKGFVVFKKDEVRGYMVIMGIPGSVDTTEVGVFIVELNDYQTHVEISSLSTNAKRFVGKALFHSMDIVFGLAPDDPVEIKPEVSSLDIK